MTNLISQIYCALISLSDKPSYEELEYMYYLRGISLIVIGCICAIILIVCILCIALLKDKQRKYPAYKHKYKDYETLPVDKTKVK